MNSVQKKSFFSQFILVLVFLFVIAISAVYGFFELYLKKNGESLIKEQIKTQTGLNINFDKLHFKFLSFLQLQPSLEIINLTVDEAFSLEKFYLELKLKSLFERKLIVDSIKIIRPKLALYSDVNQVVHLKGLDLSQFNNTSSNPVSSATETKTATSSPPQLNLIDDFNLELLDIVDALVVFEPYGTSNIEFENLNITVKDLYLSKDNEASDKVSKININTKLLGAENSKLVYKGDLGPLPLDMSSMKTKGKLDLNLNIAEIDPEWLEVNAPMLALTKSGEDHIKFNSKLSGDLLGKLTGNGNLSLNDLRIGANAQHLIKLNSLLSFSTAMNMVQNPYLDLKISNAAISVANKDFNSTSSGNLNFKLDSKILLATQLSRFDFSGSLEGLKIDELMHAFDPKAVVPVTGLFEMPYFEFKASGKTPEDLNKSLTGHGEINFHEGKIVFIDDLKKKKDSFTRFLPIDTSTLDKALDSNFAEASSKFNVAQEKVFFKDILVKSELAELTGSGKYRFDNHMNFDLLIKIPEQMKIAFRAKGDSVKPNIRVNSFNLISKPQSETASEPRSSGLSMNMDNPGAALRSMLSEAVKKTDTSKKEKVDRASQTLNQFMDIGNQFLKNK